MKGLVEPGHTRSRWRIDTTSLRSFGPDRMVEAQNLEQGEFPQ